MYLHVSTARSLLLAATACAAIVASPVAAQETADNEAQGGEIIVTAQKRTERLQDVPVAVSAVSGEQLEARQINDTNNLIKASPSLTYQQGNNPTNTTFRIRGIGSSLFGQGVEPSVSVVIDGVVAARQAQNFSDFADIERIEILRGPQGTLFGKNSTAGVIHLITKRPSKELEGNVDLTVAEHGEYRAKGSISGPIADNVQVRLSGYYNNVQGNYFNVTSNKHVGGNEGYGVRGKIAWQPTETLEFLATADYRKSDATCCQRVLVQAVNPALIQLIRPVVASVDNRSLGSDRQTFYRSEQQTYSLQGDLDLGAATLTSITAFQHFTLANSVDNDGINTNPPIYPGGSSGNAFADNWNYGTVGLDNFTQELRLASEGAHDFNYVVGAFYSNTSVDRSFLRRRAYCSSGVLGSPCAANLLTYQSSDHVADLKSSNAALFGQFDYRIIGGLKAIAGARLQRERVTVHGVRTGIPTFAGDQLFPGSGAVNGTRTAADTAVTGKAGLQYEFSRRAQVYASYTRGYKGLGFDTEISSDFANQAPVRPEHVNAYEVGFKGQTADGVMNLAVALFRADYTDLQVQANRSDPILGTVQFVQTNAGTSRTEGVEIEATIRPSETFTLNAGVTYAKTSIDIDGLNCPLAAQASAPILTGNFPINSCYRSRLPNAAGVLVTSGPIQDVRGGGLPSSPRWRINLSPRYEQPMGSVAAFLQFDLNFQSEQQFAVEQDPMLVQNAYTLVDASLGLRDIDRRWSITAFVKNLFDTNYYTTLGNGGLLSSPTNASDLYANFNKDSNRYFGVNLNYRF